MKKLLLIFAIALLFASCQQSKESYIKELKGYVEQIKEEGDDYTKEQWEKVNKEFAELLKKGEELSDKLTDEDQIEIAKIQGEYMAVELKKGGKELMKSVKDALNQGTGLMKGFMDGLEKEEDK